VVEYPGGRGLAEGFSILVGFQLIGEAIVRLGRLPVPAAVVGMMLLFLWLLWRDRVPRGLHLASGELLENLALLFVPATVIAILGLGAIASEAWAITLAVVASTFLAMGATVGSFLILEKWSAKRP
jgi:holin-like protein